LAGEFFSEPGKIIDELDVERFPARWTQNILRKGEHTMNLKPFIQRNPLTSYFVLAYGITWGGILIFLASKGFQVATLQFQDALVIFLMMFLGPSISGITLTAVLHGHNGLRELQDRLTHWQVPLRW
jgi:hypothetical protein